MLLCAFMMIIPYISNQSYYDFTGVLKMCRERSNGRVQNVNTNMSIHTLPSYFSTVHASHFYLVLFHLLTILFICVMLASIGGTEPAFWRHCLPQENCVSLDKTGAYQMKIPNSFLHHNSMPLGQSQCLFIVCQILDVYGFRD